MRTPHTRCALSGGIRIAHQVIGQGPIDLVFVPGFISNLERHREEPGYSRPLRRLSAFARVIHFDKPGTGLSDRVDVQHLPDLGTRMDDVRAVMDAVGSGRAALLGASEGAPMSILFAATYPERTRALVLYGGYAHFHGAVSSAERSAAFVRSAEQGRGTGASLASFAPGLVHDPHLSAWWARFERLSVSPTAAIALARMNATIDVRGVPGAIRVPTLVIHRRDDARVKVAAGRSPAERIPGARFVELSGRDHPIWTGDIDRVVDAIEEFPTGTHSAAASGRVLATPASPIRPTPNARRRGSATGSGPSVSGTCTAARTRSRCATAVARSDAEGKRSPRGSTDPRAPCVPRSRCGMRRPRSRSSLRSACMPARSICAAYRLPASPCMWPSASPPSPVPARSSSPAWCAIWSRARGCISRSAARVAIGGMEGPVRLLTVVAEQHLEALARPLPSPTSRR